MKVYELTFKSYTFLEQTNEAFYNGLYTLAQVGEGQICRPRLERFRQDFDESLMVHRADHHFNASFILNMAHVIM